MAEPHRIKDVALIGANGRLGKHFLQSLLATEHFSITILTRMESTATLPADVTVQRVDYNSVPSIVSALRGIQFLVITLSVFAPPDLESRIISAARSAGVQYIMPNAYGFDNQNPNLAASELYRTRSVVKCNEIEALGMKYVYMCCGFWYEWSLAAGESWFGFSISERKVTFFDDGMTKINTRLKSLLSLPAKTNGQALGVEDWANKSFYISSFHVSQRDMLESLHRVLGTTDNDWQITYEPSEKRYHDGLEGLKKGEKRAFPKALYSRIFYTNGDGSFENDWEAANQHFQLPREDLDESTRRVVELVESGWTVEKQTGM
ncbi:NAD(P)-binding protein [Polychaeton citri CBS 116435]|uniref:NAD(P)-binding protein n=1 Tax=Polychaeton citri CBS 116435 TaxID=1314669 RepID=A0A9P4QCG9_9PEZI|nr:NAD(P)-binding protein [Polychaeton citri CBS 116435]